MIKFFTYSFIGCVLILSCQAYGQGISEEESKKIGDIFLKGTYRYNLNQGVGFESFGVKTDGEKTGNENSYGFRVAADYAVADNVFVGGGLSVGGGREKDEFSGDIISNNKIWFFARGGYGARLFDDKVPFVANATLGVGNSSERQKGDGYDNKYSGFRWGASAEVGFPLNIYKNKLHFTPYAGFLYRSEKQESYKETKAGFFLKGNLELYLGCDEHVCDGERGWDVPRGRYSAGTIQIGGGAKTKLFLGGTTQTYSEDGYEDQKYKDSYNSFRLHGDTYVYPIDYLGVGAGVHLNTSTQKSKDDDFRINNSSFIFMPMVVGHVPVEGIANQAFVDVGYGFGFENSKQTGSFESTSKSSINEFYIGGGFDYYVNDNMSLTLNIGYSDITSKDKDTDVKTRKNGPSVGVAWNVYLQGWNKTF